MKEQLRYFKTEFGKEIKRIRINWFGVALIGGGMLAANGTDHIYSGEYRLKRETDKCEKILTQLNPPVFHLKIQQTFV